jgi:hypothetical protein
MRRRRASGGAAPLSPKRKWQTITVATLLLVPAYWSLLAGVVSGAIDDNDGVENPAAFVAFGLAVIPFVFIVLAFMSEHPRAPGAVLRAMGLVLLVGIPVSAIAADAVTGIVAGVGAGGAAALRPEPLHGWRPRAAGVLIASLYTYALVRTAGPLALVSAPIFPLTVLGLADHYVEWRRERAQATPAPS